ncbi:MULTISPECIES: crotonase/enoyl-CoA hydratase family protein [unclassified Sphingobium]|uniref:crotonase/enoyl-CoA hydratase family protein n=1 Tax=unclassified Sphingobium TaxID=2611147 RepID=UPI0035A5CC5E
MSKWLKPAEFIDFKVDGAIATITLNRPEKRNSLNRAMMIELEAALLEADDRADVNVVVLQAAGKDFCAGFDLVTTYNDVKKDQTEPTEEVTYRTRFGTIDDDSWHLEATQRYMMTIFDLHKPVIAKVQGNCLAGGTDLVFFCDMVIAADDAKIGFPAARANGTPPSHMWVYHLGPQWAKRILMTGDTLLGRDAARVGLVLDAVPADKLDAEVETLAQRVALVDPEILATHKRVVNMALELQGARTLQRFSATQDAIAHTGRGPRRSQFRHDMATAGLKQALRNRDEPFGDSFARAKWWDA